MPRLNGKTDFLTKLEEAMHRDLQASDDPWAWLKKHLEPGLRADESEFKAVPAEEVMRRNQSR